ncbi:MAG: hypothetical protein AAF478_01710 [Pseudomonadota bacterium]
MSIVSNTCSPHMLVATGIPNQKPKREYKRNWFPSINWPAARNVASKAENPGANRLRSDVDWLHDPIYLEMRRNW